MRACILTVGDELLVGQVVDTNATWLGEQLSHVGVHVVATATVGDDAAAIGDALGQHLALADLVVVTGGLGPTHDDVTRTAVARHLDRGLAEDPQVLDRIRARFARRGRRMPEANRVQALVPAGFTVLANPLGTAPGLWAEVDVASRTRWLAVLPGVPHEMRRLFADHILPRLTASGDLDAVVRTTLLTAGIGESNLQEKIGNLTGMLGETLRLAYLPGTGGVRLRITAVAGTRAEAEARAGRLEEVLRERAGRYVYGVDDDTLEAVVGRLLAERGLTVAVAESCTGGHVLDRLTNVSGASAYVAGGVVSYSNEAKVALLGVDPDALAVHGAVSEAVACQMAAGIRRRLKTDVGLSTTGIAGPTGGTPEKPVGTVWIGYADAGGTRASHHVLAEDRLRNKELTATTVLNLLRIRLPGYDVSDTHA